ncbi:MAG TPA: methyltransferase domain-containing protein [Steroidobacteraceae bacterium]|nr:methyltransferase domain-containing protein [Steroidobacteraceae bacterium]
MSTTSDSPLLDLLRCPRCAGALQPSATLACVGCDATYPYIDGIPWLLPEPAPALVAWRGRARALLAHLGRQARQYRGALTDDVVRAGTRNRLKLLARACDDHARRLRALLAPLAVGDDSANPATYMALEPAVAAGQGLAGYYANVHRDWCWGETENDASFAAVHAALGSDPARSVLVLGAGAGRLAYDLHERLGPERTIAADINPLLTFVARRMFAGEHLELYEFPVAPRDLASHALLRTLAAPRPSRPGLHCVFADATSPPFAAGAFDTVVTPWLVDVIDADLAALAAAVNRLLAPGGRWLCTGTLFFQQRDPAQAYSTEEVVEVVTTAGFASPTLDARRMPYLASPASRHARSEEVVTFAAAKIAEAAVAPPQRRDWLLDPRRPVPLPAAVVDRALALRVEGYVASLVDGRRSVADIAARLVEERLLLPDEASGLVQAFLLRLFDESRPPDVSEPDVRR